MFKIYRPLWDRASLGCPRATLKRGRWISQIAANGIGRTDHHRMHWLSSLRNYFYESNVLSKNKGKSLSLHTRKAGHFRHVVTPFFTFSLHTPIFFISRCTHTKHYAAILLLLYLHPDLILLLHLPFEGTNLPHLVTLCLDLAQTKSKYPYFIVLMDVSYITYCNHFLFTLLVIRLYFLFTY